MNIKEICLRIASLCGSYGESGWNRTFIKFADEIDRDWDDVKRKIIGVYAGMGSFNDLILHRDGKPIFEANDELELLRASLYKQSTENW